MKFLQKTYFILLTCCFISQSLPAQWKEVKPSQSRMGYAIPRDSLRKYWRETQENHHFLWLGIGLGGGAKDIRWTDEANFIPKRKNDVYTLRLRLMRTIDWQGSPTAYTREIATMYGKVFRGFRTMGIVSGGVAGMWGRRWTKEIGQVTTPNTGGLRSFSRTLTLYEHENFWTIGLPVRAQGFYIAGKEFALGASIGTTLNIKQVAFDAFLTVLLGIN